MNNKAFTLVELLAVIIIISILVILVMPKITNSVKNHTNKTDALTLNIIKDAAKLYIEDNTNNFIKKNDNTYCITINELVENDYLKDSIQYDNEDITHTKSVQATYNDGFDFELVDNDNCEDVRICKAVEEATTGNIPKGDYKAGDEYICEVKEGTNYRFFVLSTEGDNVNLILDRNVYYNSTTGECGLDTNGKGFVEWINETDYVKLGGRKWDDWAWNHCYGPVTAINYLYNSTKSWTNIYPLNYISDDIESGTDYVFLSNDGIGNITSCWGSSVIIGTETEPLRVRMPHYSELKDYDGTNLYLYDYMEGSIQQNIGGTIGGYWTFTAYSAIDAKGVSNNGTLYSWGPNTNNYIGVRPVISVPKLFIVN